MKKLLPTAFSVAAILSLAMSYGHGYAATGPVDISESGFSQAVINSSSPVVVEFWSPKCPHCLKMAKNVNLLANDLAGRVKVAKINVLDNRLLTWKYGVKVVPTFLLFKNGSVAAKASGEMDEPQLKKELGI